MKTLFSLIVTFALLSLTHAQNVAWPADSARWEVHLYDDFGQPVGDEIFALGPDVVIGNETYQMVSNFHVRGDSSGKVYIIPHDSTQEFLLYDFNVQQGDTVTYYWAEDTLVVDTIYTQAVTDGSMRRHYFLRDTQDQGGYGYHLIEGIGCRTHPFAPVPEPLVSGSYRLQCFLRYNQVVYTTGACITEKQTSQGRPEWFLSFNAAGDALMLHGVNRQDEPQFRFWDVSGKSCAFPLLASGEWDLRGAVPGLYFLQILQENGSDCLRFVVK